MPGDNGLELDLTYISNEAYRATINSDITELNKAIQSGMFKSKIILAGSIAEALLLGGLDRVGHVPAKKSLDELTLGELIQESATKGLLTSETQKMSELVKDFRNLVHPGRISRLSATIDVETSEISLTLLRLVHRDISSKLREQLGWTAEQVYSKAQADSSFYSIANHIFREITENELERLVLEVIPNGIILNLYEDDGSQDHADHYNSLSKKVFKLAF